MKNKIILVISIFIIYLHLDLLKAEEQFNFDITEVEVTNEGNFFKGLKRGIATTNNKNTIITANTFEYDKITNILKAKGDVIIEDKIKNYIINSEHIVYFKNEENIFSQGKTKANLESKYEVSSKDVTLDRNQNILRSSQKTVIFDDKFTKYETDKLFYLIDKNTFSGVNIKIYTNTNLKTENEKELYTFKDGIFNLEVKDFLASDTQIRLKKNTFNETKNDPRIYGASSQKNGDITKINKAIFTSCELTGDCPPWSIKAKEIIHDQKKKDVIYKHPILRVYDFPVFYMPKFTHPDPTVERRSGILQPQLNSSNIVGTSLLTPYFYVLSEDKDITFKPTIFDSEIYMFHSEYRQKNENSNFIADMGLTKGYQTKVNEIKSDHRNNIGHLFARFNSNLNLDNFKSSDLNFTFQKTTQDTFLKIFEGNLSTMNQNLIPGNSGKLKSDLNILLDHEDFRFNSGLTMYESLQGNNSDRFQYILPYYNFSKKILENDILNFNFSSDGSNNLRETNKLSSSVNNNLTISSLDYFSDFGFKNNFDIYFKNINLVGKNINQSRPDIELKNIVDLKTSLPLIKYSDNYINLLTPKLSFRINPTDMSDASNISRPMNVNKIFDINRLGVSDFEQGKSLTAGVDYKLESLYDINKYFEFKLAGVLRDVDQKNIPTSSSINQKTSNLYGDTKFSLSENIDLDYDFSLDNDLSTFEQNSIGLKLSLLPLDNSPNYKINTNINFVEVNGKAGDSNYWDNATTLNFNENNFLIFKTRRNRLTSFTEYYDLIYQYKNDCLVAGLKFKKSFYQDRDLQPIEDLLLTITFFPITQYEQRVKQSAWQGKNAIQNFWRKD